MGKKYIRKGKKPSYLERPVLEVIGEIVEYKASRATEKFKQRIYSYYKDTAVTKGAVFLDLADKNLERILEQIPQVKYVALDELDKLTKYAASDKIKKTKRTQRIYGRKPLLDSYEQYKGLREQGKTNEYIREKYKLKSPYQMGGWGRTYAAGQGAEEPVKKTKTKKGRKPMIHSFINYTILIDSGKTYDELKESYGNAALQLRAWAANYARQHKK